MRVCMILCLFGLKYESYYVAENNQISNFFKPTISRNLINCSDKENKSLAICEGLIESNNVCSLAISVKIGNFLSLITFFVYSDRNISPTLNPQSYFTLKFYTREYAKFSSIISFLASCYKPTKEENFLTTEKPLERKISSPSFRHQDLRF